MTSKNDNYRSLLNCKRILSAGRLSLALEELRQHISARPYLNGFADRLAEVSGNYDRMMQYFLEGSDGARSLEYSKSYREETFRLIQDVFMAEHLKDEEILAPIVKLSAEISPDGIDDMITYMRTGSKEQDFQQVCINYRAAIFSYILFSPQWDETTEEHLVKVATTSDEITAQLTVSAIMLSILTVFDFRKVRALFSIYRAASSCDVRERAFVGAMLSLDEKEQFWKEEQKELVQKYCSSKEDVANVLDFQKQIVYLLDTEKDFRKAREAFDISDIVERNPKLKELSASNSPEFDLIDEIISPEEEEEISERLEESMKRYLEMEKAGSDLYFKGFHLMKRLEFFDSIENWFTPFYAQHPVLGPLKAFADGSCEFVNNLQEGAPFCSSDTYSFALTLEQMAKQIPVIKNMLRIGIFKSHEQLGDNTFAASLSRRKYLQDVYRFFMLSPMRGAFLPLFDAKNVRRITFMASSFFDIKPYEEAHLAMCRFLIKRKDYKRMAHFMVQKMPDTKEYRLIKVAYTVNYDYVSEKEVELLKPILSEDPDCRPALKLLAKCHYERELYGDALEAYRKLLKFYPGNVGLERRIAVCLIKIGEYDSALEILFRLDYLHPGSTETMRALAQGLFLKGSAKKALRYLDKILAGYTVPTKDSAEDICQAAICKWAIGDSVGAIKGFAEYLTFYDLRLLHATMQGFRDVLRQYYKIEEDDFMLMADAASLYKQKMLPHRDTTGNSPKTTKEENDYGW